MTAGARALALAAAAIGAVMILWSVAGTFSESRLLVWPLQWICHGIDERSFALAGEVMPLCARCMGIYGGVIAGALAFFLGWRWIAKAPSKAILLAVVPLVVDGVAQAAGLWVGSNAQRAATGAIAAAAFLCWALLQLQNTSGAEGNERRRYS